MEERKTVETWKKLAEFVAALDYGQIVHRQEIERVTGRTYKTAQFYSDVFKAKKILTANGKAIKAIGKGDYQVLYPGDYSGAYVREVRIAKKHVQRGAKYLKGAPVNDMSTEERKEFNDVSDFNSRMQAQMAGCYVEVRKLTDGRLHPLAPKGE